MDAFEKWWHGPQPILGDGKFHDGKEVAQEAFLAGKAEGIKEGLRRAVELVGHYTSEDGEIAAETILKEVGE